MCGLLLYSLIVIFFSVFFILVKILAKIWECRNILGFENCVFSALILNGNLLINQFLANTEIKKILRFFKLSEEKYQRRPKWKYYVFCNQHLLNWFNVQRR